MTESTKTAELLTAAGLDWTPSRWGVPTVTVPGGEYLIRITEDDGTYSLAVLSGGRAELIHTEATFTGRFAEVLLLAAITTLLATLA